MKGATWLAGAAAVVLLSIPAIRHLREQPPPLPPPVHLSFDAPPEAELGSGDEGLDAAIAPDESELVFVATSGGVAQLWRRQVASGEPAPIGGTEGARYPAWKQTGGVVSFFADGKLKQIAMGDGTVTVLADAPAPGGAAWMPDGSLLFVPNARGPVRRMLDGQSSDATALTAGDHGHLFPAAVGATGDFVYVAVLESGRRVVRLASGGETRDLADTTGHAQVANAVLLRARGGVLIAQRLDPERRMPTGPSVAVAPRVGVSSAGRAMFAASARLLLFSEAASRLRDLLWHEPAKALTTRISDAGDHWQIRLSAKDERAAVTSVDPLIGTLDVLVIPTTGSGDIQPLTRALAADTDPVWSPDGTRVLFRSLQSGMPRLYTRAVGVFNAPDEPVPGSEHGDLATDWAPGRVLVQADGGATGSDIWELDLRSGTRRAVARDGFDETDGRFSPDGRWIAYVSDESGQSDVYARELTPPGPRVRVSLAGGSRPRWSRDGRSLFFVRGSRIMRADRAGGAEGRFHAAEPVLDAPGLRDFDVAHRSDRLALLLPAATDPSPATGAIVNWPTLLSQQPAAVPRR